MHLSDALIKRFQSLYKEAFGEEITAEEAQVQGLAIMRLITAREILEKERNNEQIENTLGDVYSRIAGDSITDN